MAGPAGGPPKQVADLAVRRESGAWGLDDVRVTCEPRGGDVWAVTVEVLDQVRTIEVARSTDGTARPESCGKEPAMLYRWTATVRA